MTKLFYDLGSLCYLLHQLKGAGFCCVAERKKTQACFFVL